MNILRQLLITTAIPLVIGAATCNCLAQLPPSTHYDVVVDADFSQGEMLTIMNALDEWQWAEGVDFNFSVQHEPFPEVRDMHEYSIYITGRDGVYFQLGQSSCGPDAVGCTRINKTQQSSLIVLDTDVLDGKNGLEVATHEIGHALGLLHIKQHSVMYWEINGVSQLTCQDLQEFESIRGNDRRICEPHWELDLQHP